MAWRVPLVCGVAGFLLLACGGREQSSESRRPSLTGASGGSSSTRPAASSNAAGAGSGHTASSGDGAGTGREVSTTGSFEHPPAAREETTPAGAGGTSGGAGGTTTGDVGGAPNATGGKATAAGGTTGRLGDTPAGQALVLDPEQVYIVGYVSDVNQDAGPYGIAPLATPDDTLLGVPLFAELCLRVTDGHLLWSTVDTNAQQLAQRSALYEFHWDKAGMWPNDGEPVVLDGQPLCDSAPRGSHGDANLAMDYSLGLDGAVYHSCLLNQAAPDSQFVWYTPPPGPRSFTPTPTASGSAGRILGGDDQGNLVVFDAGTGQRYETHTDAELFAGDTTITMWFASRARAGGFWLAAQTGSYQPLSSMQYVDVDLTGHVVAKGYYAPLPAEVSVDEGQMWTWKHPVIDGTGALFQFAKLGSENVIVRRPMTGQSTIVYRASDWPVTRPHTVLPEYLVTGQSWLH